MSTVRDYVGLTKPNVMSLLLFTTFTAMMMAAGGWPSPILVWWTMLGGALASALRRLRSICIWTATSMRS